MRVAVTRVTIPEMSTIGYGYGDGPAGPVMFVGDHRPMRELGEAVGLSLEPVPAEVEAIQVIQGVFVEDESGAHD